MNQKEKALALFTNNHNCAQSVICAYAEQYGISDEDAFRISQGFGGGLGGLGHTCGALSGLVMVASLHTCKHKDLDNPTKKETYEVVAKMCTEFEARNQSMNCRDILATDDGNKVLGKKACCVKCIEDCCDIIEEYLHD